MAPELRRQVLKPVTWACLAAPLLVALVEHLEGRSLICRCGRIAIWHPALDDGNSQMLLDWYSPSHLIHGFLFYLASWALARRRPLRWRFAAALAVESAWEMIENSPWIIDRYRTATMALGYSGDTILNSLADIGCMALGFWVARRLPWPATLAIALGFEALTAWVIRDGLALNILMLVHPIAAVRTWQAG